MKIHVMDCETTGLPLFKEPSEDPRQPHIVELAAMLIDGAHRAMNDVRACADVYFAVERGITVPMFSGANEGA